MSSGVKYAEMHYSIMLAHLLKNKAMSNLVLPILEPHYLTSAEVGGAPWQGLLLAVIKKHFTEFDGELPDRAAVEADLASLVTGAYTSDQYSELRVQIENFYTFSTFCDGASEEVARSVVKYISQKCIVMPGMRELLSQALLSGTLAGLSNQVQQLESRHSVLQGGRSIDKVTEYAPMAGERCSSQIPWIDSRLGSGLGFTLGAGIAIVAPQGGGKTTLGIQMCVAQAKSGRHVLLVLVEGGLDAVVKCKILACATGVPFPVLERYMKMEGGKQRIDYMAAASELKMDLAVVKKSTEMLDEYLHILDLAHTDAGGQDLDLIEAEIYALKAASKSPVYVYVDWAGILSQRLSDAALPTSVDKLKHVSYTLASMAQKNNVIIAVSTQMATDAVAKGPFASHTMMCSEGFRGFSQPMKYAIVLNPKDEVTGLQICSMPKTRDDPTPERFILKLEGEYARFTEMSHMYTVSGKRIVSKSKGGSTSRVPKV